MFNFSFKGDILYRLIPSGGIDLFIPGYSYGGYNITGHRDRDVAGPKRPVPKWPDLNGWT